MRYWYTNSVPENHKAVFLTLEENLIPLETQSQGSAPVIPSGPEGKGKGNGHSEFLITAKKWTPISTHRSKKPQNSASIQGKPHLTTFTGKIKVINPVLTSKGKLPKSVNNKFAQGTFKGTLESQGTSQRTDKACSGPEYQEQDTLDTLVDGKTLREIIPTLPFTFKFNRNPKPEDWKDMDQVHELHQLLKDIFQWSMDNKSFNLEYHWAELGERFQNICLQEIPFKDLIVITKQWNLKRKFRLLEERATRIRENQATTHSIEEQLSQIGPNLIPSGSQGVDQPNYPVASCYSGTRRSVARSHHSSQFQSKAERVGTNNPEAVGLGERSTQEPEIVVNTSRISSPNNRNITPTHNKDSIVTPDSNLESDALWLQMSQFAEQTQRNFAELQESHERMKTLTASMDKIVKTLQEGHAQLRKASEEIKKRDRDCLDQDLNKFLKVYQNMNPQPQAHVLENPYHQEDIKPDVLLEYKKGSQYQYQDGDKISYSEKETLKQLLEALSWPKFSGTREYSHMELIAYIDGLFIDVPIIPYYWITARLNRAFKGNASIWYIEMIEIHGRRSWPWWKSQIIQKYSNYYLDMEKDHVI
ncbi:hypothetical protein O181_075741 [Austropuccinia psidii MF-1]|uniref:Uncharacterized protein n=1 Tax=Austropuccinia psidii MF-1 TaxID=1389203 RepID=A0A9Q3F934_9BASI|nr:hypothetical protein [Austropuccinia psidii MF-1]